MTGDTLFIFLSYLLILSSILVIFSEHPIFSLVFLICSFVIAAFLLLLLECEFLALLFITIYVGAIAVLILFAIMMLDFKHYNMQKNVLIYSIIGFLFASVLIFFILSKVNALFVNVPENTLYKDGYINWYDLIGSTIETEALGNVLYTHFFFHLLLAGLILLVVLIGIIHLTNVTKTRELADKNQIRFKQLAKNPKIIV